MTTQIKQRRATAANWTSTNPVLGLGELGWETDTRKAKLGDGSTAWASLSYIVAPDSSALGTGTTFAGDVSGLYNALVLERASSDFSFTSDATITSTGTLSDYSLGATIAVLRWDGASALTFTGMSGGGDGRVVLLANVTSGQTLTLAHDVTSSASNRFYGASAEDVSVAPRSGVLLLYDSTLSRWVVYGQGARTIGFSVGALFEGAPPSNGARRVWTAPCNCTVTDIQALVTGGTNAVINAQRDTSDLRSADATVSAGTDYASVGGTLQNTAFSIGNDLALEIVSTSGAVTRVAIQVNFTRVV